MTVEDRVNLARDHHLQHAWRQSQLRLRTCLPEYDEYQWRLLQVQHQGKYTRYFLQKIEITLNRAFTKFATVTTDLVQVQKLFLHILSCQMVIQTQRYIFLSYLYTLVRQYIQLCLLDYSVQK